MILFIGIIFSLLEIKNMVLEKNSKSLLYIFIILVSCVVFIYKNEMKSISEFLIMIKEMLNGVN